jgi:integrase
LVKVESVKDRLRSAATETSSAEVKNQIVEIVNFQLYLQRQQYPEKTIIDYGRKLRHFVKKGLDLFDPEAIKESVAKIKKTNTKVNKLSIYGTFLKWKDIPWDKPRLIPEEIDPFLPQPSEVEQMICGMGWKLKPFLQVMWECALRGIEVNSLLWEEVDTVNRTVRIRPRKRGKPRTLRISEKCLRMLMVLPRNSEKVFGNSSVDSKRASFEQTRKRLARQLGTLRLGQIHFHTLRHLRATMWWHSGVDLPTIQQRLGHRNINQTQRYVHLSKTFFPESTEENYTKLTATIAEGEPWVQQGFKLVGKDESGCLWEKKKTFEDKLKEQELCDKSEK